MKYGERQGLIEEALADGNKTARQVAETIGVETEQASKYLYYLRQKGLVKVVGDVKDEVTDRMVNNHSWVGGQIQRVPTIGVETPDPKKPKKKETNEVNINDVGNLDLMYAGVRDYLKTANRLLEPQGQKLVISCDGTDNTLELRGEKDKEVATTRLQNMLDRRLSKLDVTRQELKDQVKRLEHMMDDINERAAQKIEAYLKDIANREKDAGKGRGRGILKRR